jgi:pyruvate formate lyase activating enzyme
LFDFKHMNDEVHKAYTGVSNRRILENARRIYNELRRPMIARIPVVPGYNASVDNVRATTSFITTYLGRDVTMHLLPYHRLGISKYVRMEKKQPMEEIMPPSEDDMQVLLEVIENAGLEGKIGG